MGTGGGPNRTWSDLGCLRMIIKIQDAHSSNISTPSQCNSMPLNTTKPPPQPPYPVPRPLAYPIFLPASAGHIIARFLQYLSYFSPASEVVEKLKLGLRWAWGGAFATQAMKGWVAKGCRQGCRHPLPRHKLRPPQFVFNLSPKLAILQSRQEYL